MPLDLTLFAAEPLMAVDVGLAAVVLGAVLYRRHHPAGVCWAITSGLILVSSWLLWHVASVFFYDPRPFAIDHVKPLLPHTANNGFPSGYAVLAAVIVVVVLFASRRWAVPFLILALLVDWARLEVGIHHGVDIAGGWICVLLATLFGYAVGPVITALLLPRIPSSWTAEQFRLGQRARGPDRMAPGASAR